MNRKSLLIVGLLIPVLAGCGFRNGQGLLARFRCADTPAYCCPPPSYDPSMTFPMANGYGAPVALPCSMPCDGGVPIQMIPGTSMPVSPELIQPVPGGVVPPLIPPPNTVPPTTTPPPGSAAPQPAPPSADPASIRRQHGLASGKPNIRP